MIRKARVKALLEMSEHDGYCSGEECDYTTMEKEFIIPVPEEYRNTPPGSLVEIDQDIWSVALPFPAEEYKEYRSDIRWHYQGYYQSHYCRIHPTAEARGLAKHDYRYKVLSVEIWEEEFTQE